MALKWWSTCGKPLHLECEARTSDGLTAGTSQFSDDHLLVTYRVEVSGHMRVEAVSANEYIAEPHVSVAEVFTEITVGNDADA